MRWFSFWELDKEIRVRINLAHVEWFALTGYDEDDETAPVTVTICFLDGKERTFTMSDQEERRLERLLDLLQDAGHLAVAV